MEKIISVKKELNFGQKALMPLLAMIMFSLIFAALTFPFPADVSGIQNAKILSVFQKWSIFGGVIFGFLSMVLMYILRLLQLKRLRLAGPLLLLLCYLPWFIFGYQLVYLEPHYAEIAIAIIVFLGKPLLYASGIIIVMALIWLLGLLLSKNKSTVLSKMIMVPFMILPLQGCLGDLIEYSCEFIDDADHCYQAAAIQSAEPEECEKIEGADFTASNPPRDKCYLIIAENTGDVTVCENIEGGPMSYTKEDCVAGVEKNVPLVMPEEANESTQADVFRRAREEILEDVDNDDVRSAIVRQMTDYRRENPNQDMDKLIEKMKEITEQQAYIKHLDEQVNEVFDELKNNITDFVTENLDEATGASEFAEKMQEQGLEWFKENAGDSVKTGIENLENLKKTYDAASEQYEKISEQIEKLQKVYDEAYEVYQKIDEVNKLVAEGKLEQDKAEVLHGAILLGKGIEYSTAYVPVFGSTISQISKETFEVTVKFATQRAQRTTALNKCIEDPENCDTEGITPY